MNNYIKFSIVLYLAGLTLLAEAQTEAHKLFRVQKDSKVGFVDNTGKVVIPITVRFALPRRKLRTSFQPVEATMLAGCVRRQAGDVNELAGKAPSLAGIVGEQAGFVAVPVWSGTEPAGNNPFLTG